MNVQSLELFVTVAERLSFAAAAEDHDTDPSTVSRQIAALERQLGARLFQRSTRSVALTEVGHQILGHARQVLAELEVMKDAAGAATTALVGRLRMSASVAYGERRIAPLLGLFREQFPGLELDLILTDARLDLVAEAIDLAIRHGPEIESDVVAARLHPTHYRVCAAPEFVRRHGAPASVDELTTMPCISYSLPDLTRRWYEVLPNAPARAFTIAAPLSLSSPLAVRGACLAGAGIALLADWLVDADIEKGRLASLLPQHRLSPGPTASAAWLVYPARAYQPRRVRATIEFIRHALGAHS
ncbi:LysR substrate-binding domain-containing protein [Devosia sp. XJ19-1]|uniref:LysR substrate-binding domain-containing protein n=1 Tax=Devosia ureilytica TaxID=2952754 RepID=A0A9Q4FTR5_9HYPH|nr:LysR family transcriptional regulator [Devosia ureilytica]MCP8884987.1 LysR substrate-binding domain-containing protein [Devosia ureilytica]MCP8888502.1 LysR substrate-binding domain-containing protein [Devosia ureilytica]